MGTLAVVAVLAGVLMIAIRSMIKDRQNGNMCSGCSGCSSCNVCKKNQDAN